MPQGPDHIYFLFNESNQSYYVNNSMVMSTASPKPLLFTPDGWRNIQIANQRNPKYFALDRSFTVPLEYVKDGAQILRYLYYNRGIEEKVFMCIAKQVLFFDATNYGYYYTLLYKGEIDFSNFEHDGPKVTVNTMEGGPIKAIKAKENTTIELDMDVPEAINVKMDGVRLQQSANYLLTNGALVNDLGHHTIALNLLGVEAITSIGATAQERVKTSNAIGVLWNLGERFLTTGADTVDITLEWDFNLFVKLASGVGAVFGTSILLQCQVLESDSVRYSIPGVPFGTNIDQKGGGDPLLLYNQTHHFQGSITFTVPANVRCILFMSATSNRELTFYTYQNNGTFNIKYTYTHPVSYIKALRPLYVLQKLIAAITDNEYTVESDALTIHEDIVVTCGDAIRGIEGSKLKTSLLAFFQSFNTVLGVGLGMVGAQLRLEKKSYWVDYTTPVDLGEVEGLAVSPATDYIYNSLKIGYASQEYEDVNGRQEFNNTHEYSLPNTRITKELNMVSPYRADCYGIEFTRINLEGKNTTDDKSDNDAYMLHVKDAPIVEDLLTVYELDRLLNAGATGLLEPETVFNLYLSPKHCFFRNADFLHSLFYKQDNKYIIFRTTEKNADVVTDITENADVEVGTLAAALFTPNILKFTTRVPVNLIATLDANPLKSFTFTWLGISFTGIPVKVSARPADKASQEYTLLSAPTNDLTQLEKING